MSDPCPAPPQRCPRLRSPPTARKPNRKPSSEADRLGRSVKPHHMSADTYGEMKDRKRAHSAFLFVATAIRAVRRGENRRLVTIVVLVGVLLGAIMSLWTWNREQETAAVNLATRGDVVAHSIDDALVEVVGRLRAVGGLYESSEQITGDEFARFVENLGLIEGLGGIGYMPIIDAGDVASFEDEMKQVIPDYALFELNSDGEREPVGDRAEYAPVQWFEPFDAFGKPHGFDALSEPNRRTAVAMARETGELAATPFLQLVSEQESDGFIFYLPVTDPISGRVVGLTVAAMDFSELLDGHLPHALLDTVGWTVTDISTGSGTSAESVNTKSWVDSLEVGGRSWMLTVTPNPNSDITPDPADAILVLIVAVTGSVIAGAGASLYRQRSQTNQELAKLRELTRAKDQFLASVSHELRTPLTGVLGFAELLRDDQSGLSGTERISLISNIATEATDMAAIIDDLLVAARSELDLLAVTRVPVTIRAQIAQVLEANTPDGRHDLVEVVADPATTYRVLGDPHRVRQILRNLISNAHAYGGTRLEVRLHGTDDTVQIQIADNGGGVPPDEQDKIFEPYYRAHNAGTKPASVGIGLSVARQLAQLMNGNLTYRRENHWSIFELELPAATQVVEPDTERQNSDAHQKLLIR